MVFNNTIIYYSFYYTIYSSYCFNVKEYIKKKYKFNT